MENVNSNTKNRLFWESENNHKTEKQRLPNTIWMFWHSGLMESPEIVKSCYQPWVEKNPNFQVIFLDNNSINNYVERPLSEEKFKKLSFQHQSDLYRLKLLSSYGGVWTDATCFCMRPLNEWLPFVFESEFFCFSKPRKDKLIDNWFLAAKPNHYIVNKMLVELQKFWENNTFNVTSYHKKAMRRLLIYILSRNERTATFWFSWPVMKLLKVYHYSTFHYLFNFLTINDEYFRRLWDKTNKYEAQGPLRLVTYGIHKDITKSLRWEIENNPEVVYKLNWKSPVLSNSSDSVFNCLRNNQCFNLNP